MQPTKDEIFDAIKKYLNYEVRYSLKFLPRPFIIELTGTPDSGKTTITQELYNSFRRSGLQRVYIPQEGAEVIQHIERTTPLYNLRTFTHALNTLIDVSHGHLYDLVIFNRCAFDAYCWMIYWLEKEKLTAAEKQLYQEFALSRLWINEIDAGFFIVCDAEEAMKREMRISGDKKFGPTTNPKTIKFLVERYKKAYAVLKPQYSQLYFLDTTNLDEREMVNSVSNTILQVFLKKSQDQ